MAASIIVNSPTPGTVNKPVNVSFTWSDIGELGGLGEYAVILRFYTTYDLWLADLNGQVTEYWESRELTTLEFLNGSDSLEFELNEVPTGHYYVSVMLGNQSTGLSVRAYLGMWQLTSSSLPPTTGRLRIVRNRPPGIDLSQSPVVCRLSDGIYHLNNEVVVHGQLEPTIRYPFHFFHPLNGDWQSLSGPLQLPQETPGVWEFGKEGHYYFWTQVAAYVIGTKIYFAGFKSRWTWTMTGDVYAQTLLWSCDGGGRPYLYIYDTVGLSWTVHEVNVNCGGYGYYGWGNSSALLPDLGTDGSILFAGTDAIVIWDIELETHIVHNGTGHQSHHRFEVGGDYYGGSMGWLGQLASDSYHIGDCNGNVFKVDYDNNLIAYASPGCTRGAMRYPQGVHLGHPNNYYPVNFPDIVYSNWNFIHAGRSGKTWMVDRVEGQMRLFRKMLGASMQVDLDLPMTVPWNVRGYAWNVYARSESNEVLLTDYHTIYSYQDASDTTAPQIVWVDPLDGETISGIKTLIARASDETELKQVNFYIDGQLIQIVTLNPGTQLALASCTLITLNYPNGDYTLQATAYDMNGNYTSAFIDVTIDNSGILVDTTPPTVIITNPQDLATVYGVVNITADCADDQALDYAQLYINGSLNPVLFQFNGAQAGTAQWKFDFSDWANGTYSISVTVFDTSGNHATDTIQVIVNNLLADVPLYLFFVPQPVDPDNWKMSREDQRALMQQLTVQTGVIPEDIRKLFNVYVGFEASATPITHAPVWDDFTLFQEAEATPIPLNTHYIRWGLKAVPTSRLTQWESVNAQRFFRILPTDRDDFFYLVAQNPASLWSWDNGTLNQLTDLNELHAITTIYEADISNDKVLFATAEGFLYYDLDVNELSAVIQFDPVGYATYTVQTLEDESILVQQGNCVYRFTFEASTEMSSDWNGGPIREIGGGVVIGGNSNAIKRLNPDGSWTSIGSLGTEDTLRIWNETIGGQIITIVGTTRAVWMDSPVLYNEFSFGANKEVRAYTSWRDSMFVAGTLEGLWKQRSSGDWYLYDALSSFTNVADMKSIGGRLWIVGESTDGTAYLAAMSADDGGSFQCGVVPPDVVATILQYIRPEEEM